MKTPPFRILSLSGGGVRGIFQAVYLKHLEKQSGKPLLSQFDLMSGTSTGSILTIAIALGESIDRVIDIYKNESGDIFSPRVLSGFRKGPRYQQQKLRAQLENIFNNRQMRDVKTNVVVTATGSDNYSHRVFSSQPVSGFDDRQLSLVDIVLASCAAPTYFSPVEPASSERAYIDGGLWANTPSLVSVLWAHHHLGVPFENMRVVSIGTGETPGGVLTAEMNALRTYSAKTISTLFDMMFQTQESAANAFARELVGPANYVQVCPQLRIPIELDDSINAIKHLPALAEKTANETSASVISLLKSEISNTEALQNSEERHVIEEELVSQELIQASGLTGFFPSRKYYTYRGNNSSIDEYVNTAKESVVMVSINLMTGLPFVNLCSIIKEKIEEKNGKFQFTISLLNPFKADLVFAISPVFNRSREQLFRSIKETLEELSQFKESLSEDAQRRFFIRCHNTIPFGSAIMLDHKTKKGRIQIETKPYGSVLNDSFAFEVAPFGSSGFYDRLVTGYERLMDDGSSIDQIDLDRDFLD